MKLVKELSFVIIYEYGAIHAHGLQKNIDVQGDGLLQLRLNIESLMTDLDGELKIPSAPQKLWDIYDEALKAGRTFDKVMDGHASLPAAYQWTENGTAEWLAKYN